MAAVHLKDLIKAQQQQQAAKNQQQERMSIAEFRKLMGLTADNTKKQVEVLGNVEKLTIQNNTAQKEQVEDTKLLVEKDVETHSRLDAIRSTLEKTLAESKNQTKTLEKLDKEAEQPKQTAEQSVEGERARDEQTKLLKKIADKIGDDKGKEEKPKKDGTGLGGILTALAVALGGVVGAVKGYVTAIVKMNKFLFGAIEQAIVYVGKFFPKLKKILFNIEVTFTLGMEMIKQAFGNFVQKALKVFDNVKDFIGGFMNKIMNSNFMKSVVGIFTKVVDGVKAFFAPIQDAFKVLEETTSPISKAISFVKDKFSAFAKFFDFLSDQMSLFGKIFGAVSKIVSKIALPLTVIMTIWDVVKGAIEGFEKEGIVGAISGAIKGLISSLITAPLDMLKDAVSWILDVFGFDNASKMLDSFSFDDLMKSFVDAVFHPIDTIKSMFEGVLDFFDKLEIPEIGFTIPVIDKKVSIGPFRPFKREGGGGGAAKTSGGATPSPAKTQDAAAAKAPEPVTGRDAVKALPGKPGDTAMIAKPSRAPGDTRVASAERDGKSAVVVTIANEPVVEGKPLSENQVIAVEAAMRSGNQPAPEVMKAYQLAKQQKSQGGAAAPQTAAPQAPAPTDASAVYNKSADNAQQAVANQGGTAQPVIVSAPVTTNVKQSQNISMSAPVRNTDRGFNRYMERNSVFI